MANPKPAAIRGRRNAPRGRGIEQRRRDVLLALRRTLRDEGYEGTVRLIQEDGRFAVALSPEPDVDDADLRHVASRDLSESIPDLLAPVRHLADLAAIAHRRAMAIAASGGKLTDPPAWAFLGNPVARGAYAAIGIDMADFRPRSTMAPTGSTLGHRTTGFRLAVGGLRAVRGATTISIDANAETARVRIHGGEWPDTLVDSLAGRPLGDVLGLPGLERGTRAGDSPIKDVWKEGAALGLTVDCALEPMGAVPDGVDVAFLSEWKDRHWK